MAAIGSGLRLAVARTRAGTGGILLANARIVSGTVLRRAPISGRPFGVAARAAHAGERARSTGALILLPRFTPAPGPRGAPAHALALRWMSSGATGGSVNATAVSASAAVAARAGNGPSGAAPSDVAALGHGVSASDGNDKDGKPKSRLANIWDKIKIEAKHYWLSSKALGAEFKIAWGIVRSLTRGHVLTRRERRQLVRTGADLIRLIPLVIVIVVPFMELVLPALLYIFPNMLPSTFEDKSKKAESVKKQLQARIGLAKFLQDMNVELLADECISASDSAAGLVAEFRSRVARGESVDNATVRKIAQLFGDKLTLQNLNREQLVTMCQYMGVTTYGTTSYLRSRLTKELSDLRKDDMAIHAEGVASLTEDELRAAVIARGMRGNGVPVEKLRAQLASWLDLHLLEEVPASLLLLSRAMLLADKVSPDVQLKATIAALPDSIVEQVRTEVKADQSDASKERDLADRLERVTLEKSAASAASTAGAGASAASDDQKQLAALKDTVLTLASNSPVGLEKSELQTLKEAKQSTRDVLPVAAASEGSSAVVKKLDAKVTSLLGKLERELVSAEAELLKDQAGSLAQAINLKGTGKISVDELRAVVAKMALPLTEAQLTELMTRIDRDRDGEITLDELAAYVDRKLAQPAVVTAPPKDSFAPPKRAE